MNNRKIAYLACLFLSVLVHGAIAGIEFPVHENKSESVQPEKLKISLKKVCPVQKTVQAPIVKPVPKPPEKKKKIVKPIKKKIEKPIKKKKVVKKQPAPIQPEQVTPVKPVETAEPVEPVQKEEVKTVSLPAPAPEPEIPPFDYDAYIGKIVGLIETAKSYPYLARKKGQQGVVSVSVLIGTEGDAIDMKLERSSGFSLLDREAMKLVASVFPLENESGENIRLVIPVRYMLN